MKTRNECREWRELLGAYALGHLEGDERAGLEAHLEGCAGCREELAALAPVARMLPHADPARFELAPQPPPELGRRIAATIEGEKQRAQQRRRRRTFGFAFGGAAAAAVAAVLVLFVFGGSSPDGRPAGPVHRPSQGHQHRRDAGAPRLRHRDPHVRARSALGDALPGLAAGAERRLLSGRDLPLPLGRRLRRGAQLRARHLADASGRGRHRQTHLRSAGERAGRSFTIGQEEST